MSIEFHPKLSSVVHGHQLRNTVGGVSGFLACA
jgi:hypothetical protein